MHVRVLCEFVCSTHVQVSEEDTKLPGAGVKEPPAVGAGIC